MNGKEILENKLACEHGRAESYKKQMVELCIREQKLEAEIADFVNKMQKNGMIILEAVEQIKELKKEIISLGKSYRYLQNKCESQRAEVAELIARCKGLVDLVVYLKNENTEHKARWENHQNWLKAVLKKEKELNKKFPLSHQENITIIQIILDKMQQLSSGGEVPAVSMGRCETVSKETKGELKPAEATKYRRVPSYYRNGIKIRGYIIKIKPQGKCVICGDKGIFQIGSGQTATLNGRDCTKSIEAHYKKGEWLCEDCLFK